MPNHGFDHVAVLGSGRWGTAMAIFLANQGAKVTLWCFADEEYQALVQHDRAPNLPDYSCDGKIHFTQNLEVACENKDLLVISTPVPFLRGLLGQLKLSQNQVVMSINKGIEQGSLQTVPELIRSYLPDQPLAHLGGPCFPEGLLSPVSPAAETLGCEDEALAIRLQAFLNAPSFRVYRSLDLKGVAILGALKNVYAILAGIASGQGMFEEALAVIVTRGLAEMKRLCEVVEISYETLYGLCGLGDLVLTCYSKSSSHNKNFGLRLGQGESVASILDSMQGTVAEGYYTTKALHQFAKKQGLELPLAEVAYQVIYEERPLLEALAQLMDRPLKTED